MKKIVIASVLGLGVGICFGAAFHHWACGFGWERCAVPAPRSANAALISPLPINSAGTTANEEHLLKLQETVLNRIEDSNNTTKEMLNFALLAVGFVGTVLLGTIGYFGFSTASDLRGQKERADNLIAQLSNEQAKVAAALVRLAETEEVMRERIWEGLRGKLSHITDYGLKIAEFAGNRWADMTKEDRLRNCDEAAEALRAADLKEGGNRALSFILARKGVALLNAGDSVAAVATLEQACASNITNQPDRHYNLACANARVAQLADAPVRQQYVMRALEELKKCLAIANNGDAGDSNSKAFFRNLMRKDGDDRDRDLDALRLSLEFQELLS